MNAALDYRLRALAHFMLQWQEGTKRCIFGSFFVGHFTTSRGAFFADTCDLVSTFLNSIFENNKL